MTEIAASLVPQNPLTDHAATQAAVIAAFAQLPQQIRFPEQVKALLASQTGGFSQRFLVPTGTQVVPVQDGFAIKLHPDLQRRAANAVRSAQDHNLGRSWPKEFHCDFAPLARAYLKVVERGFHRNEPGHGMICTALPTNIDGKCVLVAVPKYLAYTVAAGGILQGFEPDAIQTLQRDGKIAGAIIKVPLFRDFHVSSKGGDPTQNWEQVVVHSGTDGFPVIYADMEYPGPSLKKALYAIMMYGCMDPVANPHPRFPFHGAAAVLQTPSGKTSMVTIGASGAGKTETWFNPIYLSGIAEKSGIPEAEITRLWNASPILGLVPREAVKAGLKPAGDDILLIESNQGEISIRNLESNGIFLRPDGEEQRILPHLMRGRTGFGFLNYNTTPVGGEVDLGDFTVNPRIFFPVDCIPNQQMNETLPLDVFNLGVRCSSHTAMKPGLCLGLIHIVDKAALRILNTNLMRASKNPSITSTTTDTIVGEGPGSVGGFITPESAGKALFAMDRVLRELSPSTTCVLTASQNVGAQTEIGFAGQQALQLNLLTPNNITSYKLEDLIYSGHPLLGYLPKRVELPGGATVPEELLHPWKQKEVGVEGWKKALEAINQFYLKSISELLERHDNDLDADLRIILRNAKNVLHWWKFEQPLDTTPPSPQ